jgi:hypothetical protein
VNHGKPDGAGNYDVGQRIPSRNRTGVADRQTPRNEAEKPSDDFAERLDLKNNRGDKTAIELFHIGIRALALQSSIIDVVRIASRFSTAIG